MSGVVVKKAFPEASQSRDPDKFNMLGLPRISDAEHFKRAVEGGQPHSYIAARASRMEYHGEEGLGFFNAVDLHLKVIKSQKLIVSSDDIRKAFGAVSFEAALEKIGYDKLPRQYQQVIGIDVCQQKAAEARHDRHPR
ncbi:MAG: hypothetical protein R3D88_00705 [Alphaproteobacteria bacterium]|nr:hypothetical protein [Alphaproteobacteria bacterium]